jgi:hypothetical protein
MAKMHKNTATRMQARIAAVLQQREAKNVVRREKVAQQAFMAGVEQLAAQYGVDPSALMRAQQVAAAATARANSATIAPSRELVHVGGEALKPCKAVHALCATIPDATRAEMLELCYDNGINRATAQTQVGKFRAAAKAKAEAQ